jgi:hypothetical protein
VRVFEALKGLATGALAGLRQADAVALDVKAAGTAILGYWTGQEANVSFTVTIRPAAMGFTMKL